MSNAAVYALAHADISGGYYFPRDILIQSFEHQYNTGCIMSYYTSRKKQDFSSKCELLLRQFCGDGGVPALCVARVLSSALGIAA